MTVKLGELLVKAKLITPEHLAEALKEQRASGSKLGESLVKLGFITYPAHTTALYSLISFAVSGIYLSFLLTVIAAIVARARGWVPEGSFQLGRWGWTVSIVAALYLGLMLLNVVVPTGLTSGRGLFNLDWITLLVMFIIAVVGAAYFLIARPDRKVGRHLHDPLEPTGAERVG